jgi:inner membrane protein
VASITHLAVGALGGRVLAGRPHLGAMLSLAALSLLPDADVLAFSFGLPYDHAFGHRGASHSLVFAALVGILAASAARLHGARPGRTGLIVGLTVATHPLLDALTDGGLGVALWWPLSAERIFFPVRPIPVAPLGWGMLGPRGVQVMLAEALPSAVLLGLSLVPGRR